MKLYYSKGACSLAVRILINELGIDCEYESVDLKTKKTENGVDFLKINPKGAVPVLDINGQILTENAAIQQYLADREHATSLLPPVNEFPRYQVIEWLNFVSTDLHKGCGPLFNPNLSQEIKEQIFIPAIKQKLAFVDQHLGKNKYLLGNNYTLPDAYLFVILTWMSHFKIDVTQWVHLSHYFSELHQRKAIKKSLQQEELS
jgi:glutathione S-transferase